MQYDTAAPPKGEVINSGGYLTIIRRPRMGPEESIAHEAEGRMGY